MKKERERDVKREEEKFSGRERNVGVKEKEICKGQKEKKICSKRERK